MNLGRVIGNVWATRKLSVLEGKRMLLVQPLSSSGEKMGEPIVALDTVDAGPHDNVIFATSKEAAIPFPEELVPTDATIVGVVEAVSADRSR